MITELVLLKANIEIFVAQFFLLVHAKQKKFVFVWGVSFACFKMGLEVFNCFLKKEKKCSGRFWKKNY